MTVYLDMKGLPFVEPYAERGYSIHESMRDMFLRYLWANEHSTYVEYSGRLARFFGGRPAPENQIEYIYHLLIADPVDAERKLTTKLYTWSTPPHLNYDLLSALTTAVGEHGKGDRISSAIVGWGYCFEGWLAHKANESSTAVELFDKALALPGVGGKLRAELVYHRAEAKRVLWSIPEAQAGFSEALELFKALADRSGEAHALQGLGHVHRATSDFNQARELYEQALAVCRLAGDLQGEATTLRALGHIYREQGDYELACMRYEESLALCEKLNDFYEQTNVLYRLGDTHRLLGSATRSMLLFEQGLSLCHKIGDRQHAAHCELGLGLLACENGSLDEAIRRLNASLLAFEGIQHLRGQAHALLGLGRVERLKRNFESAKVYLGKALDIYEKTGSKKGEADALGGLSLVAWYAGTKSEYANLSRQAALLYEQFGGPANLGEASFHYYLSGNYIKAVELATRVLDTRTTSDVANVAFTRAHALLRLGRLEQAMASYRAAIMMCADKKQVTQAKLHLVELLNQDIEISGLSEAMRLFEDDNPRAASH